MRRNELRGTLRAVDSLTHGLLGLAIGALHAPRQRSLSPAAAERARATTRALLLGAVLAAELPDLDYLWPAGDPVLHALRAHRGVSHSIAAAPIIALLAAGAATLAFRGAHFARVATGALVAVLAGHLLADAWTGWGTRLLLPFSDARVTLDWMLVVDPLFTLPLLVAAVVGLFRRGVLQKALIVGLTLSCAYLALRVTAQAALRPRIAARYPTAASVAVFPSWFGPFSWRYVAVLPREHVAGAIRLFEAPVEQARHPLPTVAHLSLLARTNPTVQETLAWARFPVIAEARGADGDSHVQIADLRYHLNGTPTLRFDLSLDVRGRIREARLDRGGSARSLFSRFRGHQ